MLILLPWSQGERLHHRLQRASTCILRNSMFRSCQYQTLASIELKIHQNAQACPWTRDFPRKTHKVPRCWLQNLYWNQVGGKLVEKHLYHERLHDTKIFYFFSFQKWSIWLTDLTVLVNSSQFLEERLKVSTYDAHKLFSNQS